MQRGANPNVGNNRNTTPLHKAGQRGELRCLKLLLDAGAKVDSQDEDDVTPLHRYVFLPFVYFLPPCSEQQSGSITLYMIHHPHSSSFVPVKSSTGTHRLRFLLPLPLISWLTMRLVP